MKIEYPDQVEYNPNENESREISFSDGMSCKGNFILDQSTFINQPQGGVFEKEVGGDHYKLPIQPIEFISKNSIPFIEGNIIKYVCRHRNKNGAEDIKKAIHYLEMLLEIEYSKQQATS